MGGLALPVDYGDDFDRPFCCPAQNQVVSDLPEAKCAAFGRILPRVPHARASFRMFSRSLSRTSGSNAAEMLDDY
jgi:hypothetical protein